MNSFWNSSTTGPFDAQVRVAPGAPAPSGALRPADDPPECTRLKLIPPTNAVRPSTTSSLRWSRLLTSHAFFADSGLTGIELEHLHAAGRQAVEEGLRRADGPTLS